MTLLPEARRSPPPPKSTGRPTGMATTWRTTWRQAAAAIMTSDLIALVAFCLIGLLLALNLILRFPEFGAVIEQYNQF
jgi:hypothetical protein